MSDNNQNDADAAAAAIAAAEAEAKAKVEAAEAAKAAADEAEAKAKELAAHAAELNKPADMTDTPEGMVRIQVASAFTLNRENNGGTISFTPKGTNCGRPGFYDVTPDDANHWFVQANVVGAIPLPPQEGSMAAAEAERARIHRERLRLMVEEAAEREETTKRRRARQKELGDKVGGFEPNL